MVEKNWGPALYVLTGYEDGHRDRDCTDADGDTEVVALPGEE